MFTRLPLVALLALAGSLVLPVAPGAAAAPMCHGHRATIVGPDRPHGHTITGTRHRDVIVGTDTRDVIRARGGNDLVCGRNGADDIFGGPGNDRLFGQHDHTGYLPDPDSSFAIGDSINGGPGDDLINLGFDPGQTDGRLGRHVERDMVSYAGSPHGVRLDLEAGRATGEGHDVIVDRPGFVWFEGSAHDDRVLGTSGDDRGFLGQGDDVFRGRAGNDLIEEQYDDPSGADRVFGGPGDDQLSTLTGGDLLEGGPGNDQLFGEHATTYTGPRHPDRHPFDLRGGPGDDMVSIGVGIGNGDRVAGDDGTDVLEARYWRGSRGELGRADLAAGTLTMARQVIRVRPFEEYFLSAFGPLRVRGSDGSDQIGYAAPGITAHLGGGDDLLTWQAPWAPFARDDGSDDTVDGGPGTDTVDVGTGNDTCTDVEAGPC